MRCGHVVTVLPGAVGAVGTEEHDEGGNEEAYGDRDDGECGCRTQFLVSLIMRKEECVPRHAV